MTMLHSTVCVCVYVLINRLRTSLRSFTRLGPHINYHTVIDVMIGHSPSGRELTHTCGHACGCCRRALVAGGLVHNTFTRRRCHRSRSVVQTYTAHERTIHVCCCLQSIVSRAQCTSASLDSLWGCLCASRHENVTGRTKQTRYLWHCLAILCTWGQSHSRLMCYRVPLN